MIRRGSIVNSWRPRPDTLVVLEAARRTLEEAREDWPLTAGQLAYAIHRKYRFPLTAGSFARVSRVIARAYSVGALPAEGLYDGWIATCGAAAYGGQQDFRQMVAGAASRYRREVGTDAAVEVWAPPSFGPQLANALSTYAISVHSGSGRAAMFTAAARLFARQTRTVVLEVRDFDARSIARSERIRGDVAAMVARVGGPEPEFQTVAVSVDTIERYRIPPKPTRLGQQATRTEVASLPARYLHIELELAVLGVLGSQGIARTIVEEELERERLVSLYAEVPEP